MKEKSKIIFLIVILVLIIYTAFIIINNQNSKIEKNKDQTVKKNSVIEVDENNFKKEVLESDKTVLVDFYAIWCNPCKVLSPILEEIANENKDIKVVKVDVDKNYGLASKYRIQAMPTVVIIKEGKEERKIVGVQPKEEIIKLIK